MPDTDASNIEQQIANHRPAANMWVNEYVTPWDIYSHGITNVLAAAKTEYQDMSIVESPVFGKALVLDGLWQSCLGDEFMYHEPLIHPAMLQVYANGGTPKNVLVLGGGEGATVREVLKWHDVERCVMVDIDGQVVEACKQHLPEMHQGAFDDPRTELVIGDALVYLDETDTQWDLIISDLTDPIEEGPSYKLVTREYYQKCKASLSEQGVLMVQAGQVAPPLMKLHVRLLNTLSTVFDHVAPLCTPISSYGSPWGYGLCSPQPIDTRPEPEAIDQRLAESTNGQFKMFDGRTLLALLNPGKHIREAIANETRVYSEADPAAFFANAAAESGTS